MFTVGMCKFIMCFFNVDKLKAQITTMLMWTVFTTMIYYVYTLFRRKHVRLAISVAAAYMCFFNPKDNTPQVQVKDIHYTNTYTILSSVWNHFVPSPNFVIHCKTKTLLAPIQGDNGPFFLLHSTAEVDANYDMCLKKQELSLESPYTVVCCIIFIFVQKIPKRYERYWFSHTIRVSPSHQRSQ